MRECANGGRWGEGGGGLKERVSETELRGDGGGLWEVEKNPAPQGPSVDCVRPSHKKQRRGEEWHGVRSSLPVPEGIKWMRKWPPPPPPLPPPVTSSSRKTHRPHDPAPPAAPPAELTSHQGKLPHRVAVQLHAHARKRADEEPHCLSASRRSALVD